MATKKPTSLIEAMAGIGAESEAEDTQTYFPEDAEVEAGFDFEAPAEQVQYYTVLHGYGRRRPNERHYLDQYEGRGGVIKNVPEKVVESWRKEPRLRIHVLPHDATEVDYAKAAGIRPMNPKKLAAILGASDIDELIQVLGPEKTQRLIEAFQRRAAAAETNSAKRAAASR